MPKRDFLDELIEERTARNPEFPQLVEQAERRRALLKALAEQRSGQERSQTEVAAMMKSSQSAVARLEGTAGDALLSTLDRYVGALGYRVQYHLIPEGGAEAEPPVVVHGGESSAEVAA